MQKNKKVPLKSTSLKAKTFYKGIGSKIQRTSSATAEIDDGPCGASTLSSWRSESSNISLVVLDKLLF